VYFISNGIVYPVEFDSYQLKEIDNKANLFGQLKEYAADILLYLNESRYWQIGSTLRTARPYKLGRWRYDGSDGCIELNLEVSTLPYQKPLEFTT
jgi:hypothetical protein